MYMNVQLSVKYCLFYDIYTVWPPWIPWSSTEDISWATVCVGSGISTGVDLQESELWQIYQSDYR